MTAKTAADNLTTALAALTAEIGQSVEKAELVAYAAQLDEIAGALKAIRGEHAKALRVLASTKSRAKKSERVKIALAMLEASEVAAATK